MLLFLAFSSLALLASSACATPIKRNNGSPTATVANGTVEGVHLPTFSQDAFLGVPFAQPPLGDLRLRKPRSLETKYEGGVYEAKEYSTFCAGVGYDNWPYESSEDCLYLNIVRPAGTTAEDKLPVGFWIHGGGFYMGGSGDLRYNSSWVVQRSVEMNKPIIHVSTNYRTAALGFMNSAELQAAGEQNFGLYDQRLALQWVNENIVAFGGDASKVTIYGESAGASSVGYHLLGYGLESTPLFRAGILQSGGPSLFTPSNSSSYQSSFDAIVEETGCSGAGDKLDCLRGLSLEAFNSSAAGYSFGPVVDGQLVPMSPTQSLREGKFVKVPLMLGANTDEGASFGGSGLNTTQEVTASLTQRYPSLSNSSISSLLSLYPDDPLIGCPFGTGDLVIPGGLQQKRMNSIAGDASMHATRRRMSELYSQADQAVYSYRFDQPAQNSTLTAGVTHFAEVAYVFSVPNEYKTANTLGNRPGDAELAKLMTSQWVSFIHDLDPNGHGVDGAQSWPDYRSDASNFVHRRHGSVVEKDDYRKEGIQFWLDAAY
ncbi:hypothetical protein JCM6882_001313 [Rhodosporidiobolus microsporus]